MAEPRYTYMNRIAIESDIDDNVQAWFALQTFVDREYQVTSSKLTSHDFENIVRVSVEDILKNHNNLRAILERHEGTIRKRWNNKTSRSKRELLTEAWQKPLPRTHRPDFQAWRQRTNTQNETQNKSKDHYLFPYINEEDLLKPDSLLLLINSRGRHHPSKFAAADLANMRLGLVVKEMVPAYLGLRLQFVCLHGDDAVKHYGKIINMSDSDLAETPEAVMKACDQMDPWEALFILVAQRILMRFLVKCCCLILHDVERNMLSSALYPILPEPRTMELRGERTSESLDVMAAQAPYRVPSQMNFSSIMDLIRARFRAAQDHLWALLEDPGYLSDHLRDMKEHRPENMKNKFGEVHRLLKPGHEITCAAVVIGATVSKALNDIHRYSVLVQYSEMLMIAAQRLRDRPEDQENIIDFTEAAGNFQLCTSSAVQSLLQELRCSMPASPQLRGHFSFDIESKSVSKFASSVETPAGSITVRSDLGLGESEKRVLQICDILWQNGPLLKLLGPPLVLDELERLIQTEVQARTIISSHVASLIGDISMVAQCHTEIVRCHPMIQHMSKTFQMLFTKEPTPVGIETERILRKFDKALMKVETFLPAARVCAPWSTKLAYPLHKRLTKTTNETLRCSERVLDNFWATLDYEMHQRCKPFQGHFLDNFIPPGRVPKRTSEWVDVPIAPRSIISAQPGSEVDATIRFLHGSFEQNQSGRVLAKTTVKTKIKTRGQSADAGEVVNPLGESSPERSASQVKSDVIAVDARALKVFRTIFHDPHITSTPGEIRWTDFLHAMASAGFVYGKSRGSSWFFIKETSTDHCRITFHEPHPSDKLSYENARRNGRRLTLNYGWTGSTFVLKKKETLPTVPAAITTETEPNQA